MAQYKSFSNFAFFLILNVLLSSTTFLVLAGRDISSTHQDDSKNVDVKQPHLINSHDSKNADVKQQPHLINSHDSKNADVKQQPQSHHHDSKNADMKRQPQSHQHDSRNADVKQQPQSNHHDSKNANVMQPQVNNHDSKNADVKQQPQLNPRDSKNADVKQPQSFFEYDRSFLIPGLGRVILPRIGDPVNPITYNPITGNNGGLGFSFPGTGSIGPIGGYTGIPGGDDLPGGAFLPTPTGDPSNP